MHKPSSTPLAPLDTSTPEPTQRSVRALLRPLEMLADLQWPEIEGELAAEIPHDARDVVDSQAEREIDVVVRRDAAGARHTLCSILERVEEPVAISLLVDDAASVEVNELVERVVHATPSVRVIHGGAPSAGSLVLTEGEELPWSSPDIVSLQGVPAVAYLLPGLPPEGSGGSHSLVQEARGLRKLGCEARICVPHGSLRTASALYGNADGLFVAYGEGVDILEAVGRSVVAIATEHPSLALLERIAAARPEIVCAYYVQDYEPLFAPPCSARSDRALLSYRAMPGQVLFAKSHWLRNVVMALHGTFVAKVSPSLDQELFHAKERCEENGVIRVAAMVRPRTPRRRPSATLRALAAVRAELGSGVRTITFGCDADAYAQTAAGIDADDIDGEDIEADEHLGVLTRGEVAELMRRCDLFIDASAYQAFGRSGLEAMACGAVPVLPELGGVHEYAEHGRNALIFDDDRPHEMAEQIVALASDTARLRRLREAGVRSAANFSIERAAQSQLDLFSAVALRKSASTDACV